jgi:hypothetical protein
VGAVNENPVLLVAHSAIFGGHEDRTLLTIGWRFLARMPVRQPGCQQFCLGDQPVTVT